MTGAQWRVLLIFGGGVLALSVVSSTAARWLIGAVVAALLLAHANTIQAWVSQAKGGP